MKLKHLLLLQDLKRKYYFLCWTHADVQQYLKADYNVVVSKRTLKRWKKRMLDSAWEGPTRPVPPPQKALSADKEYQVIRIRRITGWGSYMFRELYGVSESTCKRIIKRHGLSRGSKIENRRIHWVKWQRRHPDSLWQVDSWQLRDGSWVIDIIDDCSRFCIGIKRVTILDTHTVISFLDEKIRVHGTPREILTDNGAEHGQTSKYSMFDEWCEKHDIKHLRSRTHKPTTTGKVERFHQTAQTELPYCNYDTELFRYRYNHIRPHRSLLGKRPAEIYFDQQIRLKGTTFTITKKWG